MRSYTSIYFIIISRVYYSQNKMILISSESVSLYGQSLLWLNMFYTFGGCIVSY